MIFRREGVSAYHRARPRQRGKAPRRCRYRAPRRWQRYLYGTFSALAGLRAIGVNLSEPWIGRAVQWLKDHQNPDGGWGERCDTYDDPTRKGKGPSTPSQTAWAVMGLACALPAEARTISMR